MKVCVFALMMLMAAPAAADDTNACYTIADADMRNFCLAKAKNERSICATIQRGDLRAQCMAEVG